MSRLLSGCARAAATVAGAAHLMPWWAVIPACLGPLAYICRNVLRYRRDCQAIRKARREDLPALMAAITAPDRRPGHRSS